MAEKRPHPQSPDLCWQFYCLLNFSHSAPSYLRVSSVWLTHRKLRPGTTPKVRKLQLAKANSGWFPSLPLCGALGIIPGFRFADAFPV